MLIEEQETLLTELLLLLGTEKETPMTDDNGTNEPVSDPTPTKKYAFHTGDTPVVPQVVEPVVESKVDPPVVVTKPEESYVVAPDRLPSFSALMSEGEEAPENLSWAKMTPTQKTATMIAAGVAMIALFIILGLGVNYLSGGRQYGVQPTPQQTA